MAPGLNRKPMFHACRFSTAVFWCAEVNKRASRDKEKRRAYNRQMSSRIYVDACGHKANERPIRFWFDPAIAENEVTGVYDIDEIEDRWYDPNAEDFKARTPEGKRFIQVQRTRGLLVTPKWIRRSEVVSQTRHRDHYRRCFGDLRSEYEDRRLRALPWG
jgi:hypothetical protein